MNTITTNNDIASKDLLAGVLEAVCQQLEISATQQERMATSYSAVGTWLDDAAHGESLQKTLIYPQGSVALQTTVKPLKNEDEEFDLDIVCHLPNVNPGTPPAQVKKLVGDRLRENETYREKLEEKKRCWRLNYAGDFHMDITPSIPDPRVPGGEFVPDKPQTPAQSIWKATNPRGYRDWFNHIANMRPAPSFVRAAEPLPIPTKFKGILRRCVQIAKRHRDCFFDRKEHRGLSESRPISVILTTLIAKSYAAECGKIRDSISEVDFLYRVIAGMPHQIVSDNNGGYLVKNETTEGENFAEKWNEDKNLPLAFTEWHRAILVEIESLIATLTLNKGLDMYANALAPMFGQHQVNRAFANIGQSFKDARDKGTLNIISSAGIAGLAASTNKAAAQVRPHTFYGKEQ